MKTKTKQKITVTLNENEAVSLYKALNGIIQNDKIDLGQARNRIINDLAKALATLPVK